jgi:hypothetical protein
MVAGAELRDKHGEASDPWLRMSIQEGASHAHATRTRLLALSLGPPHSSARQPSHISAMDQIGIEIQKSVR